MFSESEFVPDYESDGGSSQLKKRMKKGCMICGRSVGSQIIHHVVSHHMPARLFINTFCFPCGRQKGAGSSFTRFHTDCRLPTLGEVLS
jgi:hypothetical protein